MNEASYDNSMSTKENSELTFLATLKQDIGDAGSIIAFSSDVMR
jgi:hypothetical protein